MFRNLLSARFLDETLNTINLILPVADPASNYWIGKATNNSTVDPNLAFRTGNAVNSGNFPHWANRLSILSDAFNRATPNTFAQF
jgi:hypothetical protein